MKPSLVPEMLLAKQAAQFLGYGLTRFRQHVAAGHLPAPVKVAPDADPRWRLSDLRAFVANLKPVVPESSGHPVDMC